MIVEPGKTYVRRLRASGDVADALALRLRLERALAAADLHPSGLPPTAILFVRKLGGRRARVQTARTRARAAWTRSLADAVEELARRAVRPARSVVPAEAEAVVFIDQAELLSCLAVDLCDGTATARWWWRTLFKSAELSSALSTALLAAPEYVPAALEQLSERGRLVEFARALSEDDARAALHAVLDKFALHELRRAVEAGGPRDTEAHARTGEAGARADAARREQRADTAQTASVPPWSRFVPQPGGEILGRAQSCLVGVGLMLARAPTLVRASSFAELVARWQRDEGHAPDAQTLRTRSPADSPSPPRRVKFDRVREVEEAAVARGRERPKERGPETDAAAGAAPSAEASAELARRADEGADESAARAAARGEARRGGAETEEDDVRDSRASRLEEDAGSAARRAPRAQEARRTRESADAGQESATPPARQARVVTEFGGLFYLVNVGLFLRLYGDFTTPLRPGIALSIWDFVAAFGLRLCGARVKEDGVWPLLTGLAGRVEGEPLGGGFEPPDVWRVPPEWLKPFEGRGAWEWTDARARLRVRHPGGFQVIDVPLALEGAARQLEDEMRAYAHLSPTLRRASLRPAATRHASSRRGGSDDANTRARLSEASTDEGSATDGGGVTDGAVVADGVAAEKRSATEKRSAADGAFVTDEAAHVDEVEADALRRWLDWLTPYVKARLSLALGAGGVGAARTLCEARAAVRLTGTHLDVTFSLARLAIEVRVAGLDRNPGWVPAAGRYVAFHYE